MNKDNIFDYLLIFTGLRKDIKQSSQIIEIETTKTLTEKSKLINLIKRSIIPINKKRDNEELEFKQPRNITRGVYQRKYQKCLSPSNRIEGDIVIEIPHISGLQEFSINRPLEIEFERQYIKETHNKNLVLILSWMYTLCVFLLLWVQPIYTIQFVLNNNSTIKSYGPTLCFNLIYPMQYALSVLYFNTDHFEKFYKGTEPELNIKLPHIGKTIHILLIVLFAYWVSTLVILFSNDDKEFPNFKEFTLVSKILIGILLAVVWVYGRLTLGMNVILFCLTFSKHCLILKNYTDKISKYEVKIEDMISLNLMSQEIIKIRHDLEQSIDNFKNFFSTVTILGAICIGFLIEVSPENEDGSFPWTSLIFYISFQFIFLIIIWKVDHYKDDLGNYIKSANFIKKFLTRYTEIETSEKFDETQMVILNIVEENSSIIDWIVLHRVLSEDWSDFSVFGIPVSDGALFKKGIACVAIFIAVNRYLN
jgi:hypothetical protein